MTTMTKPIAAAKRALIGIPDRPARILVAEDEFLVATDIAYKLAAIGYTVVGPATDGQAAVQLAQQAKPDLALVDIRMPKLDGLSVIDTLFSQMGIPALVLSAYSDPDHVSTARTVNAFGYLVKPVSEDQLRVSLELAWHRFRENRAGLGEADDLRRRLEERKLVEQAKWLLVSKRGIGEPDAMKALQKKARDGRRALLEVAQQVIEAGDLA